MPQLRILVFLKDGPRHMSEVAAYLGSSLSSATGMIDRLVSKQLVERMHDPVDHRIVFCRLPALGQTHVERFWRVGRRHVEQVPDMLTRQELKVVVRAMEILTAAMERQAHHAPDEKQDFLPEKA